MMAHVVHGHCLANTLLKFRAILINFILSINQEVLIREHFGYFPKAKYFEDTYQLQIDFIS